MRAAIQWVGIVLLTATACTSTEAPSDVSLGDPAESIQAEPSVVGPRGEEAASNGAGRPRSAVTLPPQPDGPAATRTGAGVDYGPPSAGVTDEVVKIGVWVVNTDSACNGIGATGNTPGNCGNRDEMAEVSALTDWVNANGGVAGRTLEVIVHETLANNSSWAAQAESACEAFSQDHDVLLAVSEGLLGRPHFPACMAQRGVPVVDPGFWPWDAQAYEELSPYLYQPSRPRPERWIRAMIDDLAARAFFAGDVRIGLIRYDSEAHTRVTDAVLRPRLAAHGMQLTEEAVVGTPSSVSALGDMNAELSSHILRFKRADVNRVLFFTTGGELHFFYYRHAESQSFRPRYAVSSNDIPTLIAGNAPDGQLDGAVGVGWAPGFDVPAHQDPGLNRAARTCKRLMQEHGVEDPYQGRNTKCDTWLFIKEALDRSPALNARGIQAAVDAFRASFEPAAVLGTRFAPGRYDGPSVMRSLRYDGECTCFLYKGRSKPVR